MSSSLVSLMVILGTPDTRDICRIPLSNIQLNSKRLHAFPLRSGTRIWCPFFIQHGTGDYNQCNTARKRKSKKEACARRKKASYVYVYIWCLCGESDGMSKNLELVSKAAGYRNHTPNQCISVHWQHSIRNWHLKCSFTYNSLKNMKYSVVNLA